MINTEKLAQIFSDTDGIAAAYFFGSQVSGKTDTFSDYDFAVLLSEDWSKDKRWTLVGELLDTAFVVVGQDKADVVNVSNQPPSIEALVDVSRYVIRSLGLPAAHAYRQAPTVLANAKYIDERAAEIYDKMVRFRNLIVHQYYRVDPEDIYQILIEHLSDLQNWHTMLLQIIEAGANT